MNTDPTRLEQVFISFFGLKIHHINPTVKPLIVIAMGFVVTLLVFQCVQKIQLGITNVEIATTP